MSLYRNVQPQYDYKCKYILGGQVRQTKLKLSKSLGSDLRMFWLQGSKNLWHCIYLLIEIEIHFPEIF